MLLSGNKGLPANLRSSKGLSSIKDLGNSGPDMSIFILSLVSFNNLGPLFTGLVWGVMLEEALLSLSLGTPGALLAGVIVEVKGSGAGLAGVMFEEDADPGSVLIGL